MRIEILSEAEDDLVAGALNFMSADALVSASTFRTRVIPISTRYLKVSAAEF